MKQLYLRIKNWSEYQVDPRTKGSLPWLKLHTKMLYSRSVLMLDEVTQAHFLKLLLAATTNEDSEPRSYLKYAPDDLRFRIHAKCDIDFKALVKRGLMEIGEVSNGDFETFHVIPSESLESLGFQGLPESRESPVESKRESKSKKPEDPEAPKRPKGVNGDLQRAGKLLGDLNRTKNGKGAPKPVDPLKAIQRLCQDGDSWRVWWLMAIGPIKAHPEGLEMIFEHIRWVDKYRNPDFAKADDIPLVRDPAAVLTARVLKSVRELGIKGVPKTPVKTKAD